MGYKKISKQLGEKLEMEETQITANLLGLGLHARSHLVGYQWKWERSGISPVLFNSIQFNSIQFYMYSTFNKGALSQSCFTENRPLMSKPRATVARKNSLADNRKKPWAKPDSEGNHLPLVGTGFVQFIESILSPVMFGWGDRWQWQDEGAQLV